MRSRIVTVSKGPDRNWSQIVTSSPEDRRLGHCNSGQTTGLKPRNRGLSRVLIMAAAEEALTGREHLVPSGRPRSSSRPSRCASSCLSPRAAEMLAGKAGLALVALPGTRLDTVLVA